MPQYVLNRDHIIGCNGHMLVFKSGVPLWVADECERAVVAIGAQRVDGDNPDPLPPEPPVPDPVPTGEDRKALIHAAFDEIVARAERADWSGQNIPTRKAVEGIVKFEVTKKELDDTYRAYKIARGD